MINWPRCFQSPEEVYTNNERYSSGRYPISRGDRWHSGIHINFPTGTMLPKVHSLFRGKLAAYRITQEIQQVSRPRIIAAREHRNLPLQEQMLYEAAGEWSNRPDRFELRSNIPEGYTNNFILLKHSFIVRQLNNNPERVNFFTLFYIRLIIKESSNEIHLPFFSCDNFFYRM